jgi:hypothetical protein
MPGRPGVGLVGHEPHGGGDRHVRRADAGSPACAVSIRVASRDPTRVIAAQMPGGHDGA